MIDPLDASLKIAGSGLEAQSTRLRIVAENMANSQSTGRAPGSNPYRRKTVSFENELDRSSGVNLVKVRDVGVDRAAFRTEYDPGNPAADIRAGIQGMVIRHGEAFSISERLTVKEAGKPVYRPTVHYAYCPCDAAIASLTELRGNNYKLQSRQRIMTDKITTGNDALGALLMGHPLVSWWIRSDLSIEESVDSCPITITDGGDGQSFGLEGLAT